MSISYEGIGAWCATFAGAELSEGAAVKASANGTVSACAAGEKFCGVCVNESGRSHLVVEKNAAESTVTIML